MVPSHCRQSISCRLRVLALRHASALERALLATCWSMSYSDEYILYVQGLMLCLPHDTFISLAGAPEAWPIV